MARKIQQEVELTAKNRASREIASFRNDMERTASTIKNFAVPLAATAASVQASALALGKYAANVAQDLQDQSQRANASIAEFQAAAFAVKQFGIEQAQLSQILNNTQRRVGEFLSTGGGRMKEFFTDIAPRVGVTAEEFRGLSGPDALELFISTLDRANLSTEQQIFYQERLSSGLSQLAPIYSGNSRELQRMRDRYNEVNESLQVSAEQISDLGELGESFNLLAETGRNAAVQIGATIAPRLTQFLNNSIELIPKATNAFVDFMNKFRDAENIVQVAQLEREIERVNEQLAKATELTDQWLGRDEEFDQYNLEEVMFYRVRLEELEEQLKRLKTAQDAVGEGLGDGYINAPDFKEITIDITDFYVKSWWEAEHDRTSQHLKSLQFQMVAEEKHRRAQEQAEIEAQERRRQRLTEDIGFYTDWAGQIANSFAGIASASEASNKKSFENQQHWARGAALVNGSAAVIRAYSELGPVKGSFAAAGIIAETIRQVRSINQRKWKDSGGISSGGGFSGPGFDSGTPTNAVPTGDQIEPTVNVFIDGSLQGMVREVRTYLQESGDEMIPSNSMNARRIRSAV